jgi:beta-lactam-binding protein with PASTA domain
MDAQRDSAALEETEEIRPNENSAEAIGSDEITQADEEWPIAREYRVASDENGGIPPPADEAGEMVVASPPRSRRLPLYIGGGLLAALLALLLVLGAAWLMSRGDDSKQAQRTVPAAPSKPTKSTKAAPVSVAVPDVSGLEVTRARSVLEDAGLRVQIREATSASDTASPGEVLRQTPAAATDVAAGTAVVLTVPGAQPRIQVPAVIGLKVSDATRVLQDAGLRADVRLVRSAKPAGTVLDQTPSPEREVTSDSVVRLEVAKASPPVTIAVPRLVGSTAAEATSRLRGLGLRWTTSPVESQKLEGTVVGQSPSVGTRLRKGQTVTLEISAGPARVTVPGVVGLDEQTARGRLEAAGFHVQVVDQPTSDQNQDGMVIEQAPAGGSKSEEAGTVTLTVARLG